jgi:hypothetical protein
MRKDDKTGRRWGVNPSQRGADYEINNKWHREVMRTERHKCLKA